MSYGVFKTLEWDKNQVENPVDDSDNQDTAHEEDDQQNSGDQKHHFPEVDFLKWV